MDPDAEERGPEEVAEGFGAEARAALRATAEVFRNPNLRRAQLVLATFTFLDYSTWLALLAYAYTVGGAASVGVLSLLTSAPAALVAPFGAVLGDRGRRERVLLLTFVAAALLCGLTAALLFVDAPPILVYVPAVVVAVVLTLVRPLHGSLVPWLARRPEELTAAYASAGLLESIGLFVGPAFAGVLLALGTRWHVSGVPIVFSVAAVLMIAAAGLVARIRVPEAEREITGRVERPSGFIGEATAGLVYVWREGRPRLIVTLLGTLTLLLGLLETLTVILAFEVLHTGQAGVGFLNSAYGIGAVIGGAVAIMLAARAFLSSALRGGIFLAGLPVASISVFTSPFLVPGLLALSGAGSVITDVAGRTMLQRLVPDEKLTRAFGVLESIYLAAEGFGGFVAAMLVTWLGLAPTLLIAGLYLPALAVLVHGRIARLDVGMRVPEEEMALLRRTSIFAPLPAPRLERVARNLVPVRVPQGALATRQGDVGDRFYVIRDGRADVRIDRTHVDTLGPGEYFGEIALLQDVLRTADVVAETELDLLSLERDVFLETLSGYPASREVAMTEVERRRRAAPDAVPGSAERDAGGTRTT